ncbi:T9SS type A sorting domain-containing protein [Hymenobacter guriensis]|uniref:T9SS type A sorting domain-containing protein n=1 Tax=Hymenobacter guriensis TaxID=2793065 RepID=A0ABS0L2H8_9BACT|nr:T9SS type A sorting domain-containing protein [Hymenobacter guriensis]MBG8554326.1 T9SS type A sorting domain-containing protein [Hymenobacter guriensis]
MSLLPVYAAALRRGILSFLALISWLQATAADPVTYYSITGAPPVVTTSCITVVCTKVNNKEHATDAALDNFATLDLGIIAGSASISMKLNGTVPAYSRAGVVVSGTATVLSLNLLGGARITTYAKGVEKDKLVVDMNLLKPAIGSSRPTRLEFEAPQAFDEIKLEYYQTASIDIFNQHDLRVYYAYGISNSNQNEVQGYLSRTNSASTAVSPGALGLCLNTAVAHPERATDTDLTSNYASFSSAVDVSCPATLNVGLEGIAPAGYHAGFVIGNGGLLDASVLAGLQVRTYLGDEEQETFSGASLLRLNLLPDGSNRYYVSFATSEAFDRVSISRTELLSALNNVRLYYGFGIEPRAFEAETITLSDNTTATPNQDFQARSNSVLSVNINGTVNGIVNPQNAANASTTDYAKITSLVNVLGTQRLKVKLNGTGQAGNTAGVVLQLGEGLLDASLLNNFRINTYGGPDGNTLLESASGASALQLAVLGGNKSELTLRTTQDFTWVELEVNNGIGALGDVRMYYGLADDRPYGFPNNIVTPVVLPVELTAWQAQVQGSSVLLQWRTASEQQSSHFVVERATQAGAETFVAVGQVQAAGSSSQARTYTLRDAQAGKLGAAKLYYRLRQVDLDGHQKVSEVVVAELGAASYALQVYPNPATAAGIVQVALTGLPQLGHSVRILDNQGRLVREYPVLQLGQQLLVQQLPAGMYHVLLQGGSGQRLAIQKIVVTP